MGLIAGFRGALVAWVDATKDPAKLSGRMKLSAPGECSMGSQEFQSSTAEKPYELAEGPGETGDTGVPAESEAKSWLNPSTGLKREIGEYSDAYVLEAG
jgi:hypothetical protein